MKLPKNAFGLELIIDLKNTNDKISSRKALKEYVKQLVELIDMKPFGKCEVVHFGHDSKITSGYTVVQKVETSLISGHFSDHHKTAHLNIFSCKWFSKKVVIKFAKNYFEGKIVQAKLTDRKMK